MVQNGILQRIGRGKFNVGEEKKYIPEISSTIKTVFKVFKNFGQEQSDYEILVHRNYGVMEIRNIKTGINVKVYGKPIE